MRLTLYPADKGDCFMVTSSDGRQLLVDGGMATSYRTFVAPSMAKLAAAGGKLDLVCISHIDQDHIAGILEMLDHHVDWRVHDFQLSTGNGDHRPPGVGRPPVVDGVWHNAFDEQITENTEAIASVLASTGVILSGAADEEVQDESEQRRDLVTSVGEAIRVSRRIGPDQLGIPLNAAFGGGLAQVTENGTPVTVGLGSMTITVLAPFAKQLADLQEKWNEWLSDNAAAIAEIAAGAAADEEAIGNNLGAFVDPLTAQAGALVTALGNIGSVTAPNLASIMLLVEEGDAKFLLTGDGHPDHILQGLQLAGRLGLDMNSGLHVSVLKVQHHGSEHNIDEEFAQRITADNYVFSADGAHTNPELPAIQAILDSRLADPPQRSTNAEVTDPFTFWFNSSPEFATSDARRSHLERVKNLVESVETSSGGRLRVEFRTEQNEEDAGWEIFA